MPVPSSINDLSQTAGANSPPGSESPTTADDYLRTYASYIAQHRDGKGFALEASVASAATCDIGAANSLIVQITGTTGITSFGTTYSGPRIVRFAAALTLTHSASLVLPGAANISVGAGDVLIAVPNGNPASGWRVTAYQSAQFVVAGNRITGDFSNATAATRVSFQTSTTNGATVLQAIPNGTATTAAMLAYNGADANNAAIGGFQTTSAAANFVSTATGTGTVLPITFSISGSERFRIDTNGNALVTNATGAVGYGTGAGGAVTQATSKTTTVTLNRPAGQITMNNAALAAGASVVFQCTNGLCTTSDNVVVSYVDDFGALYRVETAVVWDGYFQIRVTNVSGGSLSQAVRINFALIKGAIS